MKTMIHTLNLSKIPQMLDMFAAVAMKTMELWQTMDFCGYKYPIPSQERYHSFLLIQFGLNSYFEGKKNSLQQNNLQWHVFRIRLHF